MEPLEIINWTRGLSILPVGAAAWLGIRKATGLVRRLLVKGDVELDTEKRAVTLMRAVRYGLGIALAVVVLMLVLSELGISVSPLLGAAGVAGVALGLAAQGIAKDFLRCVRRALLAQVKEGLERAGVANPTQRLRLLRGQH